MSLGLVAPRKGLDHIVAMGYGLELIGGDGLSW